MGFGWRQRDESSDRKLLQYIREGFEKIMAQIDDLTAAIAGVSTDVTAIAGDVTTLLADFKAAQAAGTPVDLTAAIASVTAIKTALDTADAGIKAALPAGA